MEEKSKLELDASTEAPDGQETAEKLRQPFLEAASPEKAEKPQRPLGQVFLEMYFKFGTEFKRNGDRIDCRIKHDGADQVLFSVAPTLDGAREAERRLTELVEQKERALQEQFHVGFSRQGEEIDSQWRRLPDGSLERGDMIKSRMGRLDELLGIEAALMKSSPAQLSVNGKEGLKFHFLSDTCIKDDGSRVLADYVRGDRSGKPAIYMRPKGSLGMLITEADVPKFGLPFEDSSQFLIADEIAHNTLKRLDKESGPGLEKLATSLGYAPYSDPRTQEASYLLRDRSGGFYSPAADGENWKKCNKQGEPLDAQGLPTSDEHAAAVLSKQQMRATALVRPPTDYFDTPVQEYVDAMAMLRVSAKRRVDLLNESPELYRLVKGDDQADIDLTFGKDAAGESKLIRSVDGTLVANTAEHRSRITEFEQASRPDKR